MKTKADNESMNTDAQPKGRRELTDQELEQVTGGKSRRELTDQELEQVTGRKRMNICELKKPQPGVNNRVSNLPNYFR